VSGKESIAGMTDIDELERKAQTVELTFEDYERVVYAAIPMIRLVLLKQPESKTDQDFIRHLLPIARRADSRIREDAAEKIVGYLMGRGYQLTTGMIDEIKEAAKNWRRLDKDEHKDTEQLVPLSKTAN
jgi:hypothetical protein